MKRTLWVAVVLLLCLGGPDLQAAQPGTSSSVRGVPGSEWAQTISMVTGVAISPLLGSGAVGVWKYFKTPRDQRGRLPWFAQPYFWVPALLLVAVVFAKDAMGPVIPTTLKKPFDVAEVFENKISALVAAGAFIPLIISVFPSAAGNDSTWLSSPCFAAIDIGAVGNALLTPFAMATFLLVWLAAHAINILILISPFGTVDLALKSLRLALLSSVTLTSFANPIWGAMWSLVLIVICYFLAGWSFRMTVFGTVFAWDLLTLRRTRFKPDPAANWAFTAREMDDVPVRTYGTLRRDEHGRFVLRYRPWLVLAPRTLSFPEGTYAIGKGLLHPGLLRVEGEAETSLMDFPPRFRTHDQELDRIYRLGGVRDIGLVAVWSWLKGLFGFGRRAVGTPAPG